MKKKIKNKIIKTFFLMVFGTMLITNCVNKKKYNILGKWCWQNKDGYHEMWVSEDCLLIANENIGSSRFFYYSYSNDTLNIYVQLNNGNKELADFMIIEDVKEQEMIIKQRYNKTILKRLDTLVPKIDTTVKLLYSIKDKCFK